MKIFIFFCLILMASAYQIEPLQKPCHLCLEITDHLYRGYNVTQKESVDRLHLHCNTFNPMKRKACNHLVDNYGDSMLENFRENMPNETCYENGRCLMDDKCNQCKELRMMLPEFLQSQEFTEIQAMLESECYEFPTDNMRKMCQSILQSIPEMIENTNWCRKLDYCW